MLRVFKIDRIEHNERQLGTGRVLKSVQLFYTTKNGKEAYQSVLRDYKKPELMEKLDSLKVGDTVSVETQRVEKPDGREYENVVNITKGEVAKVAYKPSFNKSSYVDNSHGMRVGNALTNAVNYIIAKDKVSITEDRIVEIASMIMNAGERLNSGAETPKKSATVSRNTVQEHHDEDDDIGNPYE